MKRLIKAVVKAGWRLTTPIRRPIARRIDARLDHLIAATLDRRMMPPIRALLESTGKSLDRMETTLDQTQRSANVAAEEMDIVLESLTREIIRLQNQVEVLQRTVEDAGLTARGGLSVVTQGDERTARVLAG